MSHKWNRLAAWVLLATALSAGGCGRPPQLSSPAYALARTFDTLCNLQRSDQLPQAKQLLDDAVAQGQLEPKEIQALQAILDHAQQGQWAKGAMEARRLLQAQTSKAP